MKYLLIFLVGVVVGLALVHPHIGGRLADRYARRRSSFDSARWYRSRRRKEDAVVTLTAVSDRSPREDRGGHVRVSSARMVRRGLE